MKATFFVLGESIDRAPEKNADILRRQLCAGHSIGLHGYSHIGFYQSPEKMLGDLERVNDILYDVMLYRTRLVRTPYGSRGKLTPQLEEALNGAGYRFWDWNVDPRDAVDAPSGEQIVRRVTRALDEMTDRPAVIVMHDMPNTAQALPEILAFLQEKAYTVRTISAHERPQNSIHVVTDQRMEEDVSVAGEDGEVTPS
jgi:peptidoglycan/xylan/chitin deacetylase (PgdA/CDA1 family)